MSHEIVRLEAVRLFIGAAGLQQRWEILLKSSHSAAALRSCIHGVHVAHSTVCRGRGLFASADLEPGSIVGFYPVHAVGIACAQGLHRWMWPSDADSFREAAQDPERQHCVQTLTHKSLEQLVQSSHAAAAMMEEPPVEIFIDACDRPLQNGWLGHIINDADVCQSGDEEEVIRYLRRGCELSNCFNVPLGPAPLMASVTTRRVCRNEELLTSYFPSFWLPLERLPDFDDASDELEEWSDLLTSQRDACEDASCRKFSKETALLGEWMSRFTPHSRRFRGMGTVAAGPHDVDEIIDDVEHIFTPAPNIKTV